ncbi:MAG: DUF1415 domain-containing protein [Pseudomonadales bacterium]|nr:DUF1415 domain-containing protein [Pseudomonadales bacterium]
MSGTQTQERVIESVRRWVRSFVIDMNLCPFARRELDAQRVRFVVTGASDVGGLLTVLAAELALLDHEPGVETTLLIHPGALADFLDYNDFLADADELLRSLDREGVYQIASFHPHYQFHGTLPEDAENYTNRSPYPMLHLLREDSVERAIAGYPEVEQIPSRNTDYLNRLGREQLARLRQACLSP